MKRILFVVSLIIVFVIIPKTTVKAEGFDADYYGRRYPDVVASCGNGAEALYEHYMQYGIFEGRFQNAEEEAAGIPAGLSGATYIDVDIANQTVVYYQLGEPVLVSECVTGNVSSGNGTPTGFYHIETKTPGKYLVGPTWNVWVDKWMRFTGAVGLHDASWRRKFGGNIYKTDGSHGCVNLPTSVAYTLYDMVDVGTAVIVH